MREIIVGAANNKRRLFSVFYFVAPSLLATSPCTFDVRRSFKKVRNFFSPGLFGYTDQNLTPNTVPAKGGGGWRPKTYIKR
jgi:hypothetical protein